MTISDVEYARLQQATGKGPEFTIADLTLDELKTLVVDPDEHLLSIDDYRNALP